MPKKTADTRQAAPLDKSRTLKLRSRPHQSPDAAKAEVAVAGLAGNAMATVQFATIPQLSLSECVLALGCTAERVQAGDLRDAEALLTVQAVALNSIFVQLALRAEQNIGQYLDAADRYMRLALKAQGQCRATLETLSVLKNPPTVFARQANIAHSPQQVNNSALLIGSGEAASSAGTAELGQSRVLEAHGERLDEGATRTAGACDSPLAPVAVFDRPTDA